MRKVVIALFFVLLVLHQDFWAWDDASLILGFMPVGLFYHAVFALASAGLGVLAIKFMWPHTSDTGDGVEPGDSSDTHR